MKSNLTIEEVDRRVNDVIRSKTDKEMAHVMMDELLWRYIDYQEEQGCKIAKRIKHLDVLELVKGWWFA